VEAKWGHTNSVVITPVKRMRGQGQKVGGEDRKGMLRGMKQKELGWKLEGETVGDIMSPTVSPSGMDNGSGKEGVVGCQWTNDEITSLLEWLLSADNTERYYKFLTSQHHYLKKVSAINP